MNKIWNYIYKIYIAFAVFLLALLVVFSGKFNAYSGYVGYILSLALSIIGMFLGSVIWTVFHELGHIVAIKKNNCKVVELSILGYQKTFDGEKYTKGFNLKNTYQGYVSFVSKDYSRLSQVYYLSLKISLLFSVVAVLIFVPFFVLFGNFYCYSLFGGALIISVFFTLLNFLSFMPTSDGLELFSKGKNEKSVQDGLEIVSRLFYGQNLGEIDETLFENVSTYNQYYCYLRKILNNQNDLAFNMLSDAKENTKKQNMPLPIEFEIECFYRDILESNQENIQNEQEIMVELCEANPSPLTLRVMIAYRLYLGDTAWAKTLFNRLMGMQSFRLVGLLDTEKKIAEKIYSPVVQNGDKNN